MSSKNTKNSPRRLSNAAQGVAVPGFSHIKTVERISEYELKRNGLRVLHMHIPGSDSVTVNVVYRVGSRHEERGKTGLAHLLEHMLFKPSRDKDGKVIDPPRYVHLQNEGALLNASTWNDRTNYYFSMPASYFNDILKTEAERMRGLIIEDKEFLPERQNVLSEYEMYADRPQSAIETAVTNAAFVSHGYGHDTIGFREDIASVTVGDLKDFYDRFYWPNNAHLIIVGDVSLEHALKGVSHAFSHIPRSNSPIPQPRASEPIQEGVRTVEINRKNPLSIVMAAFKAPSAREKEWVHAELALEHLASGKLSLLYKKLIETQKASTVSSFIYPTYDGYLMGVEATVSQGHDPEVVRDIILREIETLKGSGISKEALHRLKQRNLASALFERDGTHSIARELTEYVAMGEWDRYYSILEEVKNTTVKDIKVVLQKYLIQASSTIGIFRGTTA